MRLLLNSPDPIVPILGTTSAEVTEWVSRQSLDYVIYWVTGGHFTGKKFKPRARGRSYPIKRPTCHITIGVKDISLHDKYGQIYSLKKPRWKNKYTTMVYHDMYSIGGVWDKK